jgi:hypothetical protein
MIKGEDRSKVVPMGPVTSASAGLPYTIELWNMPRTAPERVIGRAASMVLARAIFAAAQSEHLGRRIIMRRGSRVLQESG